MPIIGALFAIGAFATSLFSDFYAEPSVLGIVANATGLASASSFAIEVGIGFLAYQVLALATAAVLTLSLLTGKRQPASNKPGSSEVSADSQSLWDDQNN
jgi:ABC-type cobalamin transport system permease subunit